MTIGTRLSPLIAMFGAVVRERTPTHAGAGSDFEELASPVIPMCRNFTRCSGDGAVVGGGQCAGFNIPEWNREAGAMASDSDMVPKKAGIKPGDFLAALIKFQQRYGLEPTGSSTRRRWS